MAGGRGERYVSGSGRVESYTPDKTKGHDEIVIRLKDGRRIRISNNTRIGIRVEPAEGDEIGYHGYHVKGTDVVHKVHSNMHQRGGWIDAPRRMKSASYTDWKSIPAISEKESPLPGPDRRDATRDDVRSVAGRAGSAVFMAKQPDGDGRVFITPRQARRNVYNKAYQDSARWRDHDWTAAAADESARSMGQAQKARYEVLSDANLIPGKVLGDRNWVGDSKRVYPFGKVPFNSSLNYPILPHQTTVGSFDPMSYISFENGLDRRIPVVMDADRAYISGAGNPNNAFSRINLGTRDPYAVWHESAHYATPVAKPPDDESGTTFWGPGGDAAPMAGNGISGYASGEKERLVAVLAEKARMVADFGVDMSTPEGYDKWRSDILGRRAESAPLGKSRPDDARRYRDSMNVTSLRNMFYQLYDAASDKSLPDADRKAAAERLRQLEESLRYDFPLAYNGGPGGGFGKSASYIAGFMVKCAEYGVDGGDLLKLASPGFLSAIFRPLSRRAGPLRREAACGNSIMMG